MKRKLIYCFNQNISGLGTSGNDVFVFVYGCEQQKWRTRRFVYVKLRLYISKQCSFWQVTFVYYVCKYSINVPQALEAAYVTQSMVLIVIWTFAYGRLFWRQIFKVYC